MINLNNVDRKDFEIRIRKIFNYFNGKVNKFNCMAKLEIEWGELYIQTAGGISRNPNIVVIYPKVIARYSNDLHWFWYNVMLTCVHELLHTDQDISFLRMTYDKAYADYIEDTVEVESYIYLANNKKMIAQDLGFYDAMNFDDYRHGISLFDCGRLYKRRNYMTHMANMIKEIIYREQDPLVDLFISVFNIPETEIWFIFGDEDILPLKIFDSCCPLDQINDIMYERIFKYTLRNIKTSYDFNDNKHLNIRFDIDVKNLFVKPIRNGSIAC